MLSAVFVYGGLLDSGSLEKDNLPMLAVSFADDGNDGHRMFFNFRRE